MFMGKKGKAGAFLMAISAVIGALDVFGVPTMGAQNFLGQIFGAGAALGVWGIRDKQERDQPTKQRGHL